MKFGISSACLYPENTEAAVAELGRAGVTELEIFYNAPSEITGEFTKLLKGYLDEYGMKLHSVHPFTSSWEPFMFFTGYERRFRDMIDYYKQYFDCMSQLGASILVFHGDRKDSIFPYEQYFERFDWLREEASRWGVTVAQENVARCQSSKPEFLAAMKQALPDVAFVLDVKQAWRSGTTPFHLLELMGKNVAHVHISDRNFSQDCLPVGQGDFDIQRFLQILDRQDYSGAVMLELYRDNFKDIGELLNSLHRMMNIGNFRNNLME